MDEESSEKRKEIKKGWVDNRDNLTIFLSLSFLRMNFSHTLILISYFIWLLANQNSELTFGSLNPKHFKIRQEIYNW